MVSGAVMCEIADIDICEAEDFEAAVLWAVWVGTFVHDKILTAL